jgi:hypothetical protein
VAVVVIGAVFFVAGVGFFAVTVRQRSQVRRVSGVPDASWIHPELALSAAATSARGTSFALPSPEPAEGRLTGWQSADGNVPEERFWDGSTWTARRQLVSGVWASVPLGD